jgi:hypothetical protein
MHMSKETVGKLGNLAFAYLVGILSILGLIATFKRLWPRRSQETTAGVVQVSQFFVLHAVDVHEIKETAGDLANSKNQCL